MGFMVLDALASSEQRQFRRLSNGQVCSWEMGAREGLLAKPRTYVNNSGTYVKYLVERFKIDVDKVLIVHDDITLELGCYRFRFGGGSVGHKGLISIVEMLGASDFYRLRVGIGQPRESVTRVDWVLSPFENQELGLLEGVLRLCSTAVTDFAAQGGVAAMNIHNRRTIDRGKPV